jgi:hypothetical protein
MTLGAAPPLLAAPPLGAAHPLLVRVLYLLQLEFCFTSSFSYTRTRTNTCCPLWFRTPPSSDTKIAHLKFLFVLRLRTGIDLRDQADLAPARSVTIGSWFSDCIGTSSLARHSRIVRVASHQIEVISTNWKIVHFASIRGARAVAVPPHARRPVPPPPSRARGSRCILHPAPAPRRLEVCIYPLFHCRSRILPSMTFPSTLQGAEALRWPASSALWVTCFFGE